VLMKCELAKRSTATTKAIWDCYYHYPPYY
jgi:hypothetical protein